MATDRLPPATMGTTATTGTTDARPPASWLVLADDLSGAADCAIGFAAAGRHAVVVLQPGAGHPAGTEVVAVDVDSRRLAPAAAAARQQAAWQAHGGPRTRLYQKMDSTLRGNWAAETAALHAAQHADPQTGRPTPAGLALVAPAFPATGRHTRDGRMWLNGEPLEQSDIWRLEQLQGPADLPALLAAQGLRSARVDAASTPAEMAALRQRLQALADEGVQAVACDAWEEAHLDRLAQASLGLDRPVFWVGSGGLARVLARRDPAMAAVRPAGAAANASTASGPVLTLLGSLSGVSVRQAAHLAEQMPGLQRLEVPPGLLRQGPGHAGWARLQQQVGEHLAQGRHLLLAIGREAQVNPAEGPQLSTALAALVQPHFHRAGHLIATGGETARAMLQAVGIDALALAREIEPGLPLSFTLEQPRRGVVTKAGAFGHEASLWLAWQALTAPPASPTASPSAARPAAPSATPCVVPSHPL